VPSFTDSKDMTGSQHIKNGSRDPSKAHQGLTFPVFYLYAKFGGPSPTPFRRYECGRRNWK